MKPQPILGKYLDDVQMGSQVLYPLSSVEWAVCSELQWCVSVGVSGFKSQTRRLLGPSPLSESADSWQLIEVPPRSSYRPRIIQPCLFPPLSAPKLGIGEETWAILRRDASSLFPQTRPFTRHPPDLNLTSHQAAAVAVVGEKFTTAVLDGSKTHTFGCSAERTGK